jgi:GNAT superfamily N-acetyltransferase
MPFRIEPVRNAKDLHAFVTFPWKLYRGDPAWVPPLIGETKKIFRPESNPFFAHGEIEPYLARIDERVVGRIAAIRNRIHEDFHQERAGFFGFFECEDSVEVAMGLLGTVRAFLRARKLEHMLGPVNPSTNDECGLLVEGFQYPPMVMMSHALPYYGPLLERCGLTKAKDLFAYYLEADQAPEKLAQASAMVQKRLPEVQLRPIDLKRLAREVDVFKTIYNQSWEKNWGFVPMTEAEIQHMARQLKQVVDPTLVRIAERDGKPVAIALGLPDVNVAVRHADGKLFPLGLLKILWYARRIKRMRLLALGVIPEFRRTGIDVLLYHSIFKDGTAKGYRAGEFSWILEDNMAIRRPIERIGARHYKTYRMYRAPVDPAV